MAPIRIGLLFSLTGPTAATERRQLQAALFAKAEYELEHTNSTCQFELIIRDICSEPNEAIKQVLDLGENGVKLVVGCYTSACRKAILPILEQYQMLLVYPTPYEGNENHPHVFYTGEVPNQQIIPILRYIKDTIGTKIYLIGSDYIYPHLINQQIYSYIDQLEGEVVGEYYIPFAQPPLFNIFKSIISSKPDAILSTVVGNNITTFYQAYREIGLNPCEIPIFSPITTEVEIMAMGNQAATGHYSCMSYFQSSECKSNKDFVKKFKAQYGGPVSSVMTNTWLGLTLLLESVELIQSTHYSEIKLSLKHRTRITPWDEIEVDTNYHLCRSIRIGKVLPDGQFKQVWKSSGHVSPDPFWSSKGIGDTIPVNHCRKDRSELPSVCPEKSSLEVYQFHEIYTNSLRYRQQLEVAKIAAQSHSNVLILGETGAGKEMLARAIHMESSRRHGPFVAVNVGAIPRELIASELFGYAEGAFTGAKKGGSLGKFEVAHQGTLFLDEIGDMPLELQVNLLRVLETRKVVRVGDHIERPVDVRIIAATHRNLKEEAAYQGAFRSDLYFRLNVFTITIPSLNERTEDIPPLAKYFLRELYNTYGQGPTRISSRAMQVLENYLWPGNVRELRNVMERTFFIAYTEQEIKANHLPEDLHPLSRTISNQSLRLMERQTIEDMLHSCTTVGEAAKRLGIARSTLYRKMDALNIHRPPK
ncbi:transporter substrate-binding protein [Ammoniphilus sp. CFH 90114]|uniref:transporter substrate-binding protein n=1 Tax=Ammoniphilus sp. CFH 90114 TaxID=2493665 RepID=UPI00100DD36A|nr:transporter substrate-binding protein [Ammoniphilus sp. CFH 90114]RXT06491.1 sigma-54-dependent Fis family transcriptional regulator [Ammoniphilus sp. CFH 90114]